MLLLAVVGEVEVETVTSRFFVSQWPARKFFMSLVARGCGDKDAMLIKQPHYN